MPTACKLSLNFLCVMQRAEGMHRHRLTQLQAGTLALTALYSQCATLVMALSTKSTEKAHWSPEETAVLVDYLYDHRAEAGDGGNFKAPTFNAAATHINPLLSQGPQKTAQMCKTKWNSVRYHHHQYIGSTDIFLVESHLCLHRDI